MYFNAAALQQGQLQKSSVSAMLVSEALRSSWWWGYCHVLQSAGGVMFELECYLHGCKCHPTRAFDLHGSDSYYRRRRAYAKEAATTSRPCPMRGCWADELACGSAIVKLNEWNQRYSGALLQDLSGLAHQEREGLLAVWESARQYTRYILELKFSTFMQLPWILCGLGNAREGAAREAGRTARAAWANTAHRAAAHEPLTLAMFSDPDIRSELDRFLDHGATLSELPLLKRVVVKLRLVRCCELSVERLHRMAAMATTHAPSATGPYISMFSGRRQELLTHVFGAFTRAEDEPCVGTPVALAQ
eukprot:3173534-Heterocapsa_arctica.AAC.1